MRKRHLTKVIEFQSQNFNIKKKKISLNTTNRSWEKKTDRSLKKESKSSETLGRREAPSASYNRYLVKKSESNRYPRL